VTAASWVPVPAGSPFPVTNLPYGVFVHEGAARVGVAIGDHVLDLAVALADKVFDQGSLNAFMAQGPDRWANVRRRVTELLTDDTHRAAVEPHLFPLREVTLRLPFEVADYVDFYASEHHASNIGRMFRPGDEPLTPNWKHLPIGYHGRAGTVVVSGTPVTRPSGQRQTSEGPVFGPSTRLDIEAELGFVVGVPSSHGTPVSASAFTDHVFGCVLVNDWSARDIQAWEYVPLGPFLGKSFATSVSPWVVPLAALQSARRPAPTRDVGPMPYLDDTGLEWALDIGMEIALDGEVVSRPPYSTMYWTAPQMLAHLTVNGASLRSGDLFASGTVSGPEREERGSLIELSWNGVEPIVLGDGATRSFLEDGDDVTITATAPGLDGTSIGFGEVRGRILPATPIG
jgi:fumarylacetoacetase